jgi:hypothetical protein
VESTGCNPAPASRRTMGRATLTISALTGSPYKDTYRSRRRVTQYSSYWKRTHGIRRARRGDCCIAPTPTMRDLESNDMDRSGRTNHEHNLRDSQAGTRFIDEPKRSGSDERSVTHLLTVVTNHKHFISSHRFLFHTEVFKVSRRICSYNQNFECPFLPTGR